MRSTHITHHAEANGARQDPNQDEDQQEHDDSLAPGSVEFRRDVDESIRAERRRGGRVGVWGHCRGRALDGARGLRYGLERQRGWPGSRSSDVLLDKRPSGRGGDFRTVESPCAERGPRRDLGVPRLTQHLLELSLFGEQRRYGGCDFPFQIVRLFERRPARTFNFRFEFALPIEQRGN